MSRKSAREAAFKAIYEIPFHSNETPLDVIEFNSANLGDELKTDNDKSYFKMITSTCFEHIDEIDSKISKHLKTWTFERLSKIDLSILRLAVCEIEYAEDIPYKVSINEAIELAKKFGDDDAPSFINGILASLIH